MIDKLPENRIPLYLVGEWIATEGGTRDLGPSMVVIKRAGHPTTFDYSEAHAHAWDTALEKLKVEILAGRLPVEGQRGGDKGKPFEIISPQEFGDEFCNPFRDTPLETIFSERRCVEFYPDNCGAIWNRWEVYCSNIRACSRADVLKLWPAPKSKKLTKPKAIAAWLKERYPSRPKMEVKDLDEIIRRDAPGIGEFSPRTLESALKEAYG